MGVVYAAEQDRARSPPASRSRSSSSAWTRRQVIARFEAERQALAMMDHPNIARVLDAGATEKGPALLRDGAGRGVPITEYCDQNGSTLRKPAARALHGPSLPRRAARPPEGRRSTATSSRPTSWSRASTTRPVPRSSTSASPKPSAITLTEKTLFTAFGQAHRHAGVHEPGAGRGSSGLDIDTRAGHLLARRTCSMSCSLGPHRLTPTTLRQAGYGRVSCRIRWRRARSRRPSRRTRLSTRAGEPG